MPTKLYVGNLAYSVNNDDLAQHFAQAGKVETATVVTDKFSGQSRGFGFVEMDNDAEAQKAIEALNGADYRGRPLTVNEARPREERSGGGGHRGGGFGGGGGGYGGGRGGSDRGRRY